MTDLVLEDIRGIAAASRHYAVVDYNRSMQEAYMEEHPPVFAFPGAIMSPGEPGPTGMSMN